MSEIDVLKDFSAQRGAMMVTAPFLGSLLASCELKVTDKIPTAAVDDKKTIYINPDFYRRLSPSERASVLAHEVLHLAFRHAARAKPLASNPADMELYNVAADAPVNHILNMHDYHLPRGAVTPYTIAEILGVPEDEVRKLSAEEIFRMLKERKREKSVEKMISSGRISTAFGDESPGAGDLRPDLGESAGEGAGQSGDTGGWDEYWRNAIYKAYVMSKNIGKSPAGLERVFQLLKPKVDWRSLLRQSLITGMGSVAASTWIKASRKHPELPGLRRYAINTIWMLIDLSGSISDGEADQFASEVFAVAKTFKATVAVIPWDTRAYGVTVLRKPGDISRLKLRGGGGTRIKSALEEVLKRMKTHDAVIILTDGFIGDVDEDDVQRLMQSVAARASVSVFCTTAAEPDIPPKWRVIKIR